jgi:hypothetical protein
MARMQDFTPFIPGLPGAFSGPPAVGMLDTSASGFESQNIFFIMIYFGKKWGRFGKKYGRNYFRHYYQKLLIKKLLK